MGFKKHQEIATNAYMSYLLSYNTDHIMKSCKAMIKRTGETIYYERNVLLYPKAGN